jgi:hypothetical protein
VVNALRAVDAREGNNRLDIRAPQLNPMELEVFEMAGLQFSA